MRTRLLAAAFATTLALTLSAEAAGLTGLGQAIFGNSTFNFTKANLAAAPVKAIGVGDLNVQLQRTKLADVQKAFGGSIRREGDGGGRADWLCYNLDGATVWFISNALGGYEFVMMVAAEATAKPHKDCDVAPASLAVPAFGIPGLGATTAELKAVFGAASGSKISYRSDRAGGYADIAQYIGYLIKSGKVVGIGIGETSVPTAH